MFYGDTSIKGKQRQTQIVSCTGIGHVGLKLFFNLKNHDIAVVDEYMHSKMHNATL
jgi:hypothetical protein